jgi:type II secretory pathway pseudopilin PulG
MIALAVMSLAGAALLNAVAGAVQSSNDSVYRSVGQGLAEQLIDEIAAAKFPTGSASMPNPIPLRSWFTTIDDYDKFSECPPRTKAGEVLGNDDGATAATAYTNLMLGKSGSRTSELAAAPNFTGRFTRSVLIERLQPSTNGWTVVSQHTPHRRVTVSVAYTANKSTRTVAQVARVFSSVSPAP